jgi:hypothetical protein
MSSASQGPGWWQASDGNWYPPQQQPGYAPPPPAPPSSPPGYAPPPGPPGPQSWSAPAYPEYPAPGGQTYGTGPAAFTGGAAKLPLAAWLLFGGIALDLISGLLPTWTVTAGGETQNIGNTGGDLVVDLLVDGVLALLVWATFTRPRTQRGTLIALTVFAGLAAVGLIGGFTFIKPPSGSPAAGLLLDTVAFGINAAGIIIAWNSRSKTQPQPGKPWG